VFGNILDSSRTRKETQRTLTGPLAVCYLEVSAKDGNTTNLYSHLRNKQPKEFSEVSKDIRPATSLQSKLPKLFKHAQAIPTTSREHKELTKAIPFVLRRICSDVYCRKARIQIYDTSLKPKVSASRENAF